RVVAAAEGLTDLRQRHVRELTAQVHRDLAGRDEHPGPRGATDVVDRQTEVRRGLGDDRRRGDLDRVVVRDEVLEHDLRERQVDLLTVELREGRDPDESTLELADVRRDARGDVAQDVVGRGQVVRGRLLAQDRDARLEVRRLDVRDETPLEA